MQVHNVEALGQLIELVAVDPQPFPVPCRSGSANHVTRRVEGMRRVLEGKGTHAQQPLLLGDGRPLIGNIERAMEHAQAATPCWARRSRQFR